MMCYYLNVQFQDQRVKENMKKKNSAKESLCFYELKQHKTWFHEEYSQFLDQREQAKLQWLQDPNQSNVDNFNNVRHEASRHFRYKKKEYLKAKTEELGTNSKIKNIRDFHRGINDLRVTSLELT